jgi:hypothetical protein
VGSPREEMKYARFRLTSKLLPLPVHSAHTESWYLPQPGLRMPVRRSWCSRFLRVSMHREHTCWVTKALTAG